jgi:prepilin-type N-terminal cleavage/methylation domain-containing protein
LKRGFTLIELLIVVAIIAILAAIAVPNFLEAQTRSKVSRAVADIRTCATAIETYAVDNNAYPRMTHVLFFGDTTYGYLRSDLTTPIAYLTSKDLIDPFGHQRKGDMDVEFLTYHNIDIYYAKWLTEYWRKCKQLYYGSWRMCSVGPDTVYRPVPDAMYDPTNGTMSIGNIWRSQKHSDSFEVPRSDTDFF